MCLGRAIIFMNHFNKPKKSFTLSTICVSKYFRKSHVSKANCLSWHCAVFKEVEEEEQRMEDLVGVRDDEYCNDNGFSDSRESSSSCETTSTSEEKKSFGGTEELSKETGFSDIVAKDEKPHLEDEKTKTSVSDIEMMKERFSKLLLGEDMSGCGHGVSTALTISNAITNLYATLFGQLWKLEPFPDETKSIWSREIEWLLCVSDHIVELKPSWQTFPDGSKLEVMTCRPRSDLYINVPALRKLDNMLLEVLDSFRNSEFWYDDQGMIIPDSDGSASLGKSFRRQESKWWLPVPHIPPSGLQEKSRKQLQIKRECGSQILKAAMAINSNVLAEMEVPQPYLDSLPKNARDSLGEVMHRYITSDQFSPNCILDCLEFSSEYQALEVANRVEASVHVWHQKTHARPRVDAVHANSKTLSWGLVREKIVDGEKWELFADRAENLLICLKQRFPGLTQTTLDISKIQFNKDVGKSILESYSRVLESLAFNIVSRIDDLLYVDDLTKQSDHHFTSVPLITAIAHKRFAIPYSVPISSTPCATAYSNPSFSPAPLLISTRGEGSPFINRKASSRGFRVKKVLTDYLTGNSNTIVEFWTSISERNHEGLAL